MKEQDVEKIREGREVLERLKELRGGSVISAQDVYKRQPDNCASSSERMSPKTLEVRITSKSPGYLMTFIAALSIYWCDKATSG